MLGTFPLRDRKGNVMIDTSMKLEGVTRIVKASIKPFDGADEAKTVYLRFDYSECSLEDVLTKASSSDRISWANGSGGRKNFDNIEDGSTVDVKANSPGVKDPMSWAIEQAKAANLSIEEWVKREVAKRGLK